MKISARGNGQGHANEVIGQALLHYSDGVRGVFFTRRQPSCPVIPFFPPLITWVGMYISSAWGLMQAPKGWACMDARRGTGGTRRKKGLSGQEKGPVKMYMTKAPPAQQDAEDNPRIPVCEHPHGSIEIVGLIRERHTHAEKP